MRYLLLLALMSLFGLLVACTPASIQDTPTMVTAPPATIAATKVPATVEGTPQATATPEAGLDKPFFDHSQATLERPIDPNCVDQFPQTIEAGQSNVICFTFDNWVIANTPGQYPLAGGYEMLAGAEGWVRQDGKDIPVIIPLATANQERGEMQVNDALVQDLKDHWYEVIEAAWAFLTDLEPGDTLWVILAMPSSDLASNSTQGFGFEATPYTEAELNEFLTTGNFEIMGNALWPVIDIDGRLAQQ